MVSEEFNPLLCLEGDGVSYQIVILVIVTSSTLQHMLEIISLVQNSIYWNRKYVKKCASSVFVCLLVSRLKDVFFL